MAKRQANRYDRIIEYIFQSKFTEGAREIPFEREEMETAATALDIRLPKNLGDLLYSYRSRTALPSSIQARAPSGEGWIIRPAGKGKYLFVASPSSIIIPTASLAETKVPDATPGIISMYALSDEQALLAVLRYNRLIDVFTGVTCYPLQSHLRTSVPGLGQVETDELYVGIDRRGAQYVFPVQAKGKTDKLGIVQIEQDFALCAVKFSNLICEPIGAQFVRDDLIALFAFEQTATGVAVSMERHYRLVPPEQVGPDDLRTYRSRAQ